MAPHGANMPGPWHLGNDIIDLADARSLGKAGNKRFLERVFSEKERADITASGRPDLALWVRWAAKEAAFKSLSKAGGKPLLFHHPSFRVSVPEPRSFRVSGPGPLPSGEDQLPEGPPSAHVSGEVRHQDARLALRVRVTGDSLHAVTWLRCESGKVPAFSYGQERATGGPEDWKNSMRGQFTDREWSCISHRASALTRLAARRALASALCEPQEDLEIGCGPGTPGRRIPEVFLRGQEIAVDLTLSHHGGLQAWAFVRF
jgi:hypothetical protein